MNDAEKKAALRSGAHLLPNVWGASHGVFAMLPPLTRAASHR
jgi:hypothetical protein